MASWWCKLYAGTPAELALEPAVASLGRPYRFQHPFWLFNGKLKFFGDFVLTEDKIVIEVDDTSHRKPAKRLKDAQRTEALNQAGYRVVRCTNAEALRDPHGTVARLLPDITKAK